MRKTDVLEPTPTKHQLQEWPTAKQPTIRMYAKIKRPIPSVPGVNVAVDNTYSDHNNHPTVGDKLLLQNTIAPITIAEFNATVKKTRKKAPGIDGLMVDSFKDLGKNGKTILISLYNEIYRTGIFPENWKKGILCPIYKIGKPASDPSSYRPITLLPVAGKILESLVLNRINK